MCAAMFDIPSILEDARERRSLHELRRCEEICLELCITRETPWIPGPFGDEIPRAFPWPSRGSGIPNRPAISFRTISAPACGQSGRGILTTEFAHLEGFFYASTLIGPSCSSRTDRGAVLFETGCCPIPRNRAANKYQEPIVWWFFSKASGRAKDLTRACQQLIHRMQ